MNLSGKTERAFEKVGYVSKLRELVKNNLPTLTRSFPFKKPKKNSNNQLCSLFLNSLNKKIATSSWAAYLLQTP
jgi:hypothetical protein